MPEGKEQLQNCRLQTVMSLRWRSAIITLASCLTTMTSCRNTNKPCRTTGKLCRTTNKSCRTCFGIFGTSSDPETSSGWLTGSWSSFSDASVAMARELKSFSWYRCNRKRDEVITDQVNTMMNQCDAMPYQSDIKTNCNEVIANYNGVITNYKETVPNY